MASKSVRAALSVSFSEPRFSCGRVYKIFTTRETVFYVKQLLIVCAFADLSAFNLLANQEGHLLRVFWRVVCATGGGQSISAGSPRLLVITGQGLSQVPMSNKSVELNKILAFYINLNHIPKAESYLIASPDISLVYSHTKANGSHNNQDLPLHPFVLDLCAITRLQTCREFKQLSPEPFELF